MDEKDYYIHSGLGIPTGTDKPINLIKENDTEKKTIADIADKFSRTNVLSANEIRSILKKKK